jgi:hypothetical protein
MNDYKTRWYQSWIKWYKRQIKEHQNRVEWHRNEIKRHQKEIEQCQNEMDDQNRNSTTTTYYKLTDQNMQTHNGFQWTLGKWEKAKGKPAQELCSDAWLHCYDSPLIAMLHNPIHADIENPRLFKVEVRGEGKDYNGLKRGFQEMRLVEELAVPVISRNQRIRYGILCALMVWVEPSFVEWADNWLSGKNRSVKAAEAARRTARIRAAKEVRAIRGAVWTAARAAQAAETTGIEAAAWAAGAAEVAAMAAMAAARAAEADIWAAEAAGAATGSRVDFVRLAEQAMQDEN